MIDNHPMLGKEVEFNTETHDGEKRTVVGVVTGARRGMPITNIETLEITGKTMQLRIKPNDGSRAFWTPTMRDLTDEQEKPAGSGEG